MRWRYGITDAPDERVSIHRATQMAHDVKTAERLRELLSTRRDVVEKKDRSYCTLC
jgi:hypothetical protein